MNTTEIKILNEFQVTNYHDQILDEESYGEEDGLESDHLYKDWKEKWDALKAKCDEIVAKGEPWIDPDFTDTEGLETKDGRRGWEWKRASVYYPKYELFVEETT